MESKRGKKNKRFSCRDHLRKKKKRGGGREQKKSKISISKNKSTECC